MPLQNRVDPFGQLIATPERGAWLGNRGHLLNAQGRLVRPWQLKRWLICMLAFKGRQRTVWTPGLYTELFFLDEATALAAGHRPCAECRRPAAVTFRRAWEAAHGPVRTLVELDALLHEWRGRRFTAPLATLPSGTMVACHGEAHLWHHRSLHRWTPAGYTRAAAATAEPVDVLTPRPTVEALRHGYAPQAGPFREPPE